MNSTEIAVALINAVVGIVGPALAYLGLRSRIDNGQNEVREEVKNRVEEAKAVNLVQIEVSNNFNQKLEKIHQGQNHLIREVNQVKRDVRTLSEKTGIAIGEER